ncbi:MAG: c-type cytochrome [Acidobacteria bacterium]|nr:c-type cytochrome [Acidobacteriota bacterium]
MRRISTLMMSVLILFVAVFLTVTVGAQSRGAAPAAAVPKNPVATSATSVTAGAAAYKKYCSFCHGADAKGNGPLAPKDSMPPDLTDATWKLGSTDGEIFTVISNGGGATSKMIAFKGKMPDQDIWHIVNFLRSLGPKGGAR